MGRIPKSGIRSKPLRDLTGLVFDRLTVIGYQSRDSKGRNHWDCLCLCGNEKTVRADALLSGATKSCGCFLSESTTKRKQTHSMSRDKVYWVWHQMNQRCHNPNNQHYRNYGGRGIAVCERWQNFEGFISDMGVPEEGMTIERIDNERGYSSDNCRWATRKEQMNNTRRNHILVHDGKSMTLTQWAELLGMKPTTLQYRIQQGWGVDRALTTPVR